ncbi:MAG: phosphatase PAP2 family protein [Pseudomonadota bacterium]
MNLRPLNLDPLREHLNQRWEARCDLQSTSGSRWLLAMTLVALALATAVGLIYGPRGLFLPLNGAAAGLPDGFWGLVTSLGDGLLLATLALFVAYRFPHLLWVLLLGVFIGLVVTHGPKELLDMPRPAGVLETGSFNLVGPGHTSKGPPSGHTIATFMLASVAIHVIRSTPWRVTLLLLASLIGFSRVAVGEHWPFDVLLGAAVGSFATWLTIRLARSWPAGRNVWVHLGMVVLFTWAAVELVRFDPPYPLGHELNILVGSLALVVVVRDYLLGSLFRSMDTARSL